MNMIFASVIRFSWTTFNITFEIQTALKACHVTIIEGFFVYILASFLQFFILSISYYKHQKFSQVLLSSWKFLTLAIFNHFWHSTSFPYGYKPLDQDTDLFTQNQINVFTFLCSKKFFMTSKSQAITNTMHTRFS